MALIFDMKMRMIMVVVIHPDIDSKKISDDRHNYQS